MDEKLIEPKSILSLFVTSNICQLIFYAETDDDEPQISSEELSFFCLSDLASHPFMQADLFIATSEVKQFIIDNAEIVSEKIMEFSSNFFLDELPNVLCKNDAERGLLRFMQQKFPKKYELLRLLLIPSKYHFKSTKIVQIDMATMQGLNIFVEEKHPSIFSGRGKSKEGYSIFNLFSKLVSTRQGQKLLKYWFENPTYDKDIVTQRQKITDYFRNSFSSDTLLGLKKSLAKVKELNLILSKAKLALFKSNDLSRLYSTFESIKTICECINNESNKKIDSPSFFGHISLHYKKLIKLGFIVNSHFFDTKSGKNIKIKEGHSEELDKIKRVSNHLSEILVIYAEEEMDQLKKLNPNPDQNFQLKISYIPEIGYKILFSTVSAQLNLPEDWAFCFECENTHFYTSNLTLKLDSTFGTIHDTVIDVEINIIEQYQEELIKNEEAFEELDKAIAEFDCFLSFTLASIKYDLVKPIIVDKPALIVGGARNLLCELISEGQCIPNDFCVFNYKDDPIDLILKTKTNDQSLVNPNYSNRITILMGANFSGKSIFLKTVMNFFFDKLQFEQIGTLFFLSAIGSFVPAEFCKIGLIKNIMFFGAESSEDIQDQTQRILDKALPESLILIDEYGKNLKNKTSLTLCCSLLKYFQEKGDLSPILIFATHLHELKEYFTNSYYLRFFTMDILATSNEFPIKNNDKSNESNNNKNYIAENSNIVYLYKIKPGLPSSSFAYAVGRRVGLNPKILSGFLEFLGNGEIIQNEVTENHEQYMKNVIIEICDKIQKKTKKRNFKINNDFAFKEADECDILL